MAHKPVGNCVSIACTPVNNRTDAIAHKTDSLRVVAIGTFAHVAIGTFPTDTRADYMVIEGEAATIALGKPGSQRISGITSGATTTLDMPEGVASQFTVGDAVSLTVTGQSDYDFTHKIVKSIDSHPGFSGYHSERIVVDHDSSADNPASLLSTSYAELRSSFKVGTITHVGIGSVYIQQVNPSSPA